MACLPEEAEEAIGSDDRRLRVGERVELEGWPGEEVAVENDANSPGFVVHDTEGRDGAGGEAERLLKPPGAREGETARSERFGEEPEVEEPLRREDDEPGGPFPILQEEILAVAPGDMGRRDLRLGHREDRIVKERASLDAEPGQEVEEAGRVERGALRVVGRHGCGF